MKSALIRAWRDDDVDRLAAAAAAGRFSPRTLSRRFHGGVPALPASYLPGIRLRWCDSWDGVVAEVDGELVGWAEWGAAVPAAVPGAGAVDVAACVADAAQGRGIGTALLSAALTAAADAGFARARVDIEWDNAPAWRAWRKAAGVAGSTVALTSPVAA